MKKKGYTLAEALIAMGIIGVVSALMLPMMNKFKPDENKVLFIKTYDAISEVVSDLVSKGTDDDIYPHYAEHKVENVTAKIDFSGAPLENYSKVYVLSEGDYKKFTHKSQKFCWALQQNMHVLSVEQNVPAICTLTLANNVEIKIEPKDSYFKTIIDVDGFNNGEDSLIGNKAEQFEIAILPNGYIAPVSEMAQFYIATRTNWKKIDKEKYEKEKGAVKNYTDEINYWKEQSEVTCEIDNPYITCVLMMNNYLFNNNK